MKVLVIASEPISADRLRKALGGTADDAEIMVVAPALHVVSPRRRRRAKSAAPSGEAPARRP